jgi:adenylyltransferase/sulfurtransferase
MVDYLAFFSRQVKLWGEEKQTRLRQKRIAIVGSGGLGSSLVMALGASGVGHIDLIDFDTVAIHNIHRQIAFCLDDEGRNKAEAAAALARERSPFVQVEPYAAPFETYAQKERPLDLILDATDNLPTRTQIDAYAKRVGCPWVYGAVEAFNGQVCLIDRSSFEAFRVMDREPAGIAAPMVMQIAAFQANLALRYLAGLPVDRDSLYYFYFNEAGEWVTQRFAMPV